MAVKPGLSRRDTGSAHAELGSGLSRMRANFHVQFSGEGAAATLRPYPASVEALFPHSCRPLALLRSELVSALKNRDEAKESA